MKENKYTNVVPTDYKLSQNYPNPFNPATKIQYSISKASNVKLTIYNMLGQRVEVLVDGFRNAGSYEVTWNAKSLPSGVYIYTIESSNNLISKKMTLLK